MIDFGAAALIFIRVAAMIALVPAPRQVLSLRLRIALAVGLAALIVPLTMPHVSGAFNQRFWIECAFEQLLLGAFLGGAIHLWVASFAMAGSWIGQVSGWGINETADDGETSVGPIGQLHAWLGGLAFFAIDGPSMCIKALMDSFSAMPIGGSPWQVASLAGLMASILTQSFGLALRVGSPILASLIASALAVAAIQRALPHVNLVRFQIAGNWLLLMVALFLTISFNMDHWSQQVAALLEDLPREWSRHHLPIAAN
jgi:flagellar biosynthetic protein FliR